MQPTATTLAPVSDAASSVSTESFLADSTKPQVLTTTTSADSSASTSSQPPSASRPASSSESTSLRAQPRVSRATRRDVVGEDTTHRVTAGPDKLLCMDAAAGDELVVRRARTTDVRAMKSLVDGYAGQVLLAKALVTLYEDVQEFWVAELGGELVGCGALHVLWEDIAEIRTVAVAPSASGRGVGGALVGRLVAVARELGLARIFVLTFETAFFARHGFREIQGTPVTPEVYEQMRNSLDEGVAEFLDLPYVKPNTLGNSRMLLEL